MCHTVAVVVTYNRKDLLGQCIRCLLTQRGASCDVLVIDNASTDGTSTMVKEKFDLPSVRYENTGANLGGAGGFQYGAKRAVQLGYDYVWMMDDDTLPTEAALSELFKADRELKGKWGFLSSVAYWTDGSICRMNIQKRDIFRHVGNSEYSSSFAKIKMCSFVSLLVKADVIRVVGLPIGEYFIWTDDYEFTGRISKEYPCYMVPGSRVTHAMRTHIRVNFAQDDASRIGRYHYIYRNDVHCYRQYGIAGWCYILLKDIYTIFDVLMHSKKEKVKKIGVICRGFIEGLRFRPTIEIVGGGTLLSKLLEFFRAIYMPQVIAPEGSVAA